MPFSTLRRPPVCHVCAHPTCRYCTSSPLSQRGWLFSEAGIHLKASPQQIPPSPGFSGLPGL